MRLKYWTGERERVCVFDALEELGEHRHTFGSVLRFSVNIILRGIRELLYTKHIDTLVSYTQTGPVSNKSMHRFVVKLGLSRYYIIYNCAPVFE